MYVHTCVPKGPLVATRESVEHVTNLAALNKHAVIKTWLHADTRKAQRREGLNGGLAASTPPG